MKAMTTTNIPLFPIPECVTFPHTVFPLHVFEPRYRAMVRFCLENDSLLGIAHTQKVLSDTKSTSDDSLEKRLSSNQSTYKPHLVFSAGRCELLKTLDDGRLYLQVHMESRFRIVSELQTLPYSVVSCERYDDLAVDTLDEVELAKEKVQRRLLAILSDVPQLQTLLLSQEWQEKSPIDFSFEVFSLLQFDADLRQTMLEMRSPQERLYSLLELINQTH